MEKAKKTRKASIKNPKAFIGVIFCIFISASITFAAQGDYSPQRDGITSKSHPYGLNYNDFNNFTDNYTLCYMRYWSDRADDKNCNKDYQDERDFLVAGNLSDSDDRYYHTLNSANIGDTIRLMFYYHNNAEETRDNKYTAKDVTAYINYTDADSPQGQVYCSNCNNKNIYDLVTINASKQFKLEYIANSIQIVSKDIAGEGEILKLKDTDSRLKFSKNEIQFSDGDVPGCYPHDRYIYFDFKVVEFEEEQPPVVECSSIELTPSSANIEDFFDRSGDPVDPVTFGLKNVKPSDFDGNFSWKGESGGSFTSPDSPFRLTQITTDSKSDTVNFYADREGAKLTVQSSEYANCTDYVTVGGRCGDSHVWEGKEECDDGNTSNADECTTSCELTYCGDKTKQSPNGERKDGPKDDGYEDCDDGNTSNGDECTTACVLTYCGDKIVQKPNGKHEKGSDGKGNEECDDGNSSSSDQCTSSCEFTYCGDSIVQKPNGEKKGGPKDDGYEDCDDGPKGSATCTTQCTTIIEEIPECDSVSINNSEVLAIIETQVSVTVKPSDYTPALTWVASEDSGEFEGENPYFSGSDTSVSFENGAIGEIIYVYDKSDLTCADQITVTGCEDLSVSPTSIDLDRDTLPVTITLVTDPTTWNREMIFTSTDTTATFDGQPSGYRTTSRKVLYTGTNESTIEIVDATGLYTNPTPEFPYDCTAKISVTKEKTLCGDEIVQKPNDDGFYEECDDGKDGETTDQCTDSCTLTFCGDDIIQKPNGRGTGGPKDDGYEECDGESYCSSNCTIEEELACDSLTFLKEDFTEDQVSEGKKITLEVNPEPDTYPDDVSWQCTGNGKFIVSETEYPCNNNQIYNFDVTKVEYTGGKENDTITAFDENFQSICRDSFKIGPAVTPPQPFCGDGHVDSGEQCDDGNKTSGDGCDATCQTEGGGGPVCGDGQLDSGEQCDDGNKTSGDGCDATCQTEGGGGPVCGDGQLDSGEQCDDGNKTSGDGCDANCQTEQPPGNGGPPGDGGPPGGGACEIDIKTKDGFVLYDGSEYPEKISLSDIDIPLNFQIDNSGAEPYYLESTNKHSGNFSGIFTAYQQKWDSEADETGNPLDSSEHYFTLTNPSGEDISRFENIGVGSVVTIRSMSEDCAAQFEFVEEGEEVPPGGEEVCVDLKASVDELNANTRLPLMVELTPNPSTFEGKYRWTTTSKLTAELTFNGSNPYESVDRTVTLENSTGKDKFGTNGNINIKSIDYPEDCRVDIPVGDNDALVKGLICPRTQSNIASNGDIVDYAIIYYFEPTGRVDWVNIWDSIGQPSGIPGSLGENDHVEMYSTPMIELIKQSTRITLSTCEEGTTSICYEGSLDEAQGITIKNLQSDTSLDLQNDYIKINYWGKLHAGKDLKCQEETTNECQAEYFLNEAKSFAYIDEDTGLAHTSYATVWAICPFLIAENTGDVFFEDSLGVGTDLSCIDPSLKNTTGLAVQEIPVIPEGAIGSPIIPNIFDCENTGPDVIGRFSSFVCEIETVVDDQWKQTKIESRVFENSIQSTRYFEKRESTAPLDNLSINGLDTVIGSQSQNIKSHIYRVSGDLDIKNNYDTRINISDDGARTIIVEGNLSIFSNIEYDPNASKDYKKIPSIAFIVMGDIYIDPNVETLVGVFYTENALKSMGDVDSNKTLTIKGSIYGDIEPLFKKRTGFGDPERNEGAITILYDERILLNTPPGLTDFVDITQTEVAR